MSDLETYTPEQVARMVEHFHQEVCDAGWDDAIYYTYEVSASSATGLFRRLLNQQTVIPRTLSQEASGYSAKSLIREYGNGISFGGILDTGIENITRLLTWGGSAEDNEELDMRAGEVHTLLMSGAVREADELAAKYCADYSEEELPPVYRGFLRVLIPVNYHGPE